MSGKAEGDGPSVKADEAVVNRAAKSNGYVLVYGHKTEETLEWPKGLSAVMVNDAGEVFGTGVNSLVGGDYPKSCPMKVGGGEVLQSYVKVNDFSDWPVKKLAVGLGFGAALTSRGEVLIWGGPLDLGPDDFVSFETEGMKCSSCSGFCFSRVFGCTYVPYCSICCKYLEAPFQDNSRLIRVFIRYHSGRPKPTCPTCNRLCSSTKTLNNMNFYFCAKCNKLLEKGPAFLNRNPGTLTKLMRTDGERVKDIACTDSSICMLLECNKLVLRNYATGHELAQPLGGIKSTAEQTPVKIVSLYCGGERCFASSEEGTLFECSTFWDSNSPFKLTEISLPAAVEKLGCGLTISAALLVDGSVWFITGGNVKTYPLHDNAGLNTFADVAAVGFTDAFLVQNSNEMKSGMCEMKMKFAEGAGNVVVRISETDLSSAISKMIPGYVIAQDLAPPIAKVAHLYGKTFLSDMTIQLSDGEFPAHSSVLVSTSAHFKETFTASKTPPKVLDVTEYNAKAYRCLLQYFYQLKPDDLDAEDLVDLRQIATSYGETALATATTAKIKSKLDGNNVLKIFSRAKHLGFQDLMAECKQIMRSPTYQEKLLQDALKNANLN